MGLADRDYARDGNASHRRTKRPGVGGVGTMYAATESSGKPAITTWLIIINIAIFAITLLVFRKPVEVPYGEAYAQNVTLQQQREAVVNTNEQAVAFKNRPGIYGYPIYGQQRDAAGRIVVDPAGRPVLVPIGTKLVMFQPWLEAWGHFSTARAFFGLEVWRFITFQFLHANITHLGFNMLGLWFAGYLVEGYLGKRRFLAFYLTCGIFGSLMYLLLNLSGNILAHQFNVQQNAVLNPLLFDSVYTPLVGASAGIFGLLIAAAFIAPDDRVYVLGIIPMKLRTAAYGFTIIALISLLFGEQNKGGEAAHIGGAIAGYFFIRRMHLLRDFFDVFGDSRSPNDPPSPPQSAGGGFFGFFRKKDDPRRVDEILQKISDKGLASLTREEKMVLARNSRQARTENPQQPKPTEPPPPSA
ncbi:MAG: rhomboid family intramembrane serine protease [Phycisphaerales bacterium]|nr:rhomboid family intramembrane serine protease [Phycisphaerales bacterium]